MRTCLLIVLTLLIPAWNHLFAQGCSDAGVCSIGGMKEQAGIRSGYMIALNTQYGLGEKNTSIITPQLEFSVRLDSNYRLQVKMPWVFTSGNLGRTNGLGDIILTGSRRLSEKNGVRFGLNAGFRIAVNDADIRQQSNVSANTTDILPMPYQTSLGTHDLLLGADLKIKKKWLFAVGLQIPLIQNNRNGFDTALLSPTEDDKREHFSSKHLVRMPDFVLRIDRSFKIADRLIFNAGLLPIYHLGNDSRLNSLGRITIDESSGLTLNVNTGLQFQMDDHFRFTARYASPLIVRKVRPDGLTRHYTGAFEIAYSF